MNFIKTRTENVAKQGKDAEECLQNAQGDMSIESLCIEEKKNVSVGIDRKLREGKKARIVESGVKSIVGKQSGKSVF